MFDEIGHVPQLEAPTRFVAVVEAWLRADGTGRRLDAKGAASSRYSRYRASMRGPYVCSATRRFNLRVGVR